MGTILRNLGVAIVLLSTIPSAAEEILLEQAKTQMRAGQLKEASQSVRKFLKANPKNSKGWELSARIHLRMKETMLAIVEYTKAIEKDPAPRAELYVARARAWTLIPFEKEKNITRALRSLEEGLKRLGSSQTLLSYKGELEAMRKTGPVVEDRAPDGDLEIKAIKATRF